MFQRFEFIGAGRDGGRRHGQLHNPTSWTHSLQQCQYMTNNFFSFSTHYSTVCIGGPKKIQHGKRQAWATQPAEMPTPGETAGACAYYKDKEARGTDIVEIEYPFIRKDKR